MAGVDPTHTDLLDFVGTAAIGLHWVASDGTIVWANPADYEPLGYTQAEYIGRNIAEFHADPPTLAEIMSRLASGERLTDHPARLRRKDGSTRDVLITSSARRDDEGAFLHTRCFTIDVSARLGDLAQAQIEALTREVERLSAVASRKRGLIDAILNQSPHGVIVSDADGKLSLQNKAAERIWAGSATANTVEDWAKYRAFHPDGRPFAATDWAMARALLHREVVEPEETQIQRFDGTRGVLLGSSAPVFGPDGELDGAVSVFSDITDLKQNEADLRVAAERYFTTLKSIGDAVITTDATGAIQFLNPVAEQLTGWSVDDASGKPLADVFRIVHEHTRAEVESPVDKVIREGVIVGLANHTILVGKGGTEIAIDDSGAPIFDPSGVLVGVVLVFRDVTEKRHEEDRRAFMAEASALLASSLDFGPTLATLARLAVPRIADWSAVDVVEADGTIARLEVAHVDPAKVRYVDELTAKYPPDPASPYGAHEVIRTGASQLIPEIPDELLVQAAVDDEHLRLIRELGLKSSMVVPLRCRGRTLGAISLVSAESNRRYGPTDLAFAEELANLAALALDNARLYRDAQDANRSKDEFLASLSHELRTPLHAMLGWAHLLRTTALADDQRDRALATIERNARAQAQLVDDLLDVSRIISGNLRLQSCALDLGALVEAAADAVRFAADSKGVRIKLALDDEARAATGDPGRLQQIAWNLLSNAIKFTEKGGEVVVRLTRSGSALELEVTDTGIGLEPDLLPRIFDRFTQASGATTRAHTGLGLGLAIVRHLVELHGGTVVASSAGRNRGSSFLVVLPIAATAAAVRRAVTNHAAEVQVTAPPLHGLKVLVVDDDDEARALLIAILVGQGARVFAAGSAAEALRRIENDPPDVLVSDIGMPHEDGYSLIRKVRALPRGDAKTIPALALTAYATPADRSHALLAGFQSHLAKPVDPNELLVMIAALGGRIGG